MALNRRKLLELLCFGKNTYTPVAYIVSNGQQIIDTGINPDDTTVVEFYGKISHTARMSIMGCVDTNRFHFYSHASGTTEKYFYTGTTGYPFTSIDTWVLTKYRMQKGGLYVNDVRKITSNNSIAGNQNIWIFNCNNQGKPNTTAVGAFRCYGVKIWKQNILVRDMIPVLDPTGNACLFDLIESKYYYDINGGSFEYVTGYKGLQKTLHWDFTSETPTVDKAGNNNAIATYFTFDENGATVSSKTINTCIKSSSSISNGGCITFVLKIGTYSDFPSYNRLALIGDNQSSYLTAYYNQGTNVLEVGSKINTKVNITEIFEKTITLSMFENQYKLFVDGEMRASGSTPTPSDLNLILFKGGSANDYSSDFNCKQFVIYQSNEIWTEEEAKSHLI